MLMNYNYFKCGVFGSVFYFGDVFESVFDGPKGRYPCQSFTGTLRSLLVVGFELAWSMLLIPMSILQIFGSRLVAVVGCNMVLRRH
jgi:hypothetical protein